jgi:predicted transcriptional regulator
MNTTSPISARVDETTLKDLDRLAEELDRSRSWLVAQAVSEYVKRETEFLEFVKVGENEIENGDFHTQGEMEAWIEDRISKRAGKEESRS